MQEAKWLDRLEIAALIERAEFDLEFGTAADYAGVFAENGRLTSPSKDVGGRAAIETALRQMHASGFLASKRNFLGPQRIDVTGDQATAVTKWLIADIANGPRLWATGVYRDTLVRTGEGWRIVHRLHVPD